MKKKHRKIHLPIVLSNLQEEENNLERVSNFILKEKQKTKREVMSPELKKVSIDCKNIFIKNNVKYKKHYYYNGPEIKKVKFYNVIPTGKNPIKLDDLTNTLSKINNIVGIEINTNNKGICSITVFTLLAGNKQSLFDNTIETIRIEKEAPKEIPEEESIELVKTEVDQMEDPVEVIEEKEKEIKSSIITGVAETENEQELINYIKAGKDLSSEVIDKFYPDLVIEKILNEDAEYIPTLNDENKIAWLKMINK